VDIDGFWWPLRREPGDSKIAGLKKIFCRIVVLDALRNRERLLTPGNGLHRAGINSFLTTTGIALVRADYGGFLIDQLEHGGTDLRTMAAADTQVFIYDWSL